MVSRKRHALAWWQVTAAEARGHAVLMASLLWIVASVIAFAGPGYRSVFGPLKGSDFIQFYTLGHLDGQTAATTLYNPDTFHRLQTQLVPESEAEHYLVVYPPHVTLLFRPFAGLTYGSAALLWAAILAAAYAACIWLAWRPFRHLLQDRRLLFAAAAAFPPFWYLVLHGQTTIVPLVAFCLGWLSLEHRRPFWAGMAFGLLLLKPQFALVLVPLVLVCRQWAMLGGAALSVAIQIAAAVVFLGQTVWWDYAALLMQFPQLNGLLEPRPAQMHSISALTNRLPDGWGAIVWMILSALVVFRTVRVWRSGAPVAVRTGVLVLASVLINPHVFVYDAAVLAPALVWFAAWAYGEAPTLRSARTAFALGVYGLYLSLLFPTATFVPIQLSVLLLGGLFVLLSRDLVRLHDETVAHALVAMPSQS